jgi:cytoskeleton protein RodZ
MTSIGSHLRELRERHSVALEDLAQSTRIGQRFLEALENDDFAALPAGPFAKGFIRSYCQALNEPADEPLALYARTVEPAAPRLERIAPPPRRTRSLAPVLVSLALLAILGAALGGLTMVLRSGRGDGGVARAPAPPLDARSPRAAADRPVPPAAPRAEDPRADTPPPVEPPAAPLAPPSPPAERPPSPAERRLPSTAVAGTPYRLVARASDPTWIRVRMEGGRTIEETIPAGEVREWISNHPFELRIGNAGGVILELNGQVLPSLGARGAVVTRLVLPTAPQ